MASEKETKTRTSYTNNVKYRLEEVTALRKQGYNYDMISKTLGITRKTLYEYSKKYEELREAIARGKKEYEVDLTQSLYARAKGFMITEKTIRNYYNADGDLIKTEKMEKERYIYSDFMAAKLLKLENVLDNDDMPLELQELMKTTQQNIDDEYADE